MPSIIGRALLPLGFAWLAALAFAGSLACFAYVYFVTFGHAAGPGGAPAALLSPPALVNYTLFTLFALHHSVFARTGAKAVVRRAVPASLERAVYTMVASLLFVATCLWWQPVAGMAWTLPGPARALGYAAQAAGIVITLAGARALDVLELAGVRQARQTPRAAAPLKVDGVYGFVRHPLYFAWALLVFGAPDMTMTRLSFALISTLYLAVAIPFEERGLIETFGRDYASYREKVRWRMLPGLY
jgi:protein-S-isoprenylcysteine O-methyltransferase Ste14